MLENSIYVRRKFVPDTKKAKKSGAKLVPDTKNGKKSGVKFFTVVPDTKKAKKSGENPLSS